MPDPVRKSNVIPFPRCPAPADDAIDYDALLQDLTEEHKPRTVVERALVEMMARQYCLLQRSIRDQQQAFASEDGGRELAGLIRRQSAADRGFHKALDALIAFRRSRGR